MSDNDALNTRRRSSANGNKEQEQLPKIYWAIEFNLPPGFRRHKSQTHGYCWVMHPHRFSNLSVRIYPEVEKQIINIKVVDESPRNSRNPEHGLEIKKWSTKVMMAGENSDWKRRLAGKLGEASVQAKKQPTCPKCRERLVLRQATSVQFFGCPRYPRCNGSLSIGDFEAETSRRPLATASLVASQPTPAISANSA